MRLTELSISGFKSFAKTTRFEFPASVNAVVGPNGSGKSNVAEAIRWVLGEQSMKTLRGKRGEDLIFNGSASSPRMGKAFVALTFDNRDHALPLDFEKVTLERKIFRDGANEYFLNDSQVRLKDVVELLARIGLGETKHNIIGQGEVDRLLIASPRDRREMLEEAIGLRLYQLKKREAERKLEETAKNILQVEALEKEISPHLKFLKSQAEKAERREAVRRELDDLWRAYITNERAAIVLRDRELLRESSPAQARLTVLEHEISTIARELESVEKGLGKETADEHAGEIAQFELRRRELERALGRIEGKLETRPSARSEEIRRIDVATVEEHIRPIARDLRNAADGEDISLLRAEVQKAFERLEALLAKLMPAALPLPAASAQDLEAERTRTQRELEELDQKLAHLFTAAEAKAERARLAEGAMRGRFQKLREHEEEAQTLRTALQRTQFEQEKLRLRREELARDIEESGFPHSIPNDDASPFAPLEREDLKKKIERMKLRIEEIGGIDPAVLKEYHDTKTRHEFLNRELTDLVSAAKDLQKLVDELAGRIESDFQTGFSRIKKEFQQYFQIIFGGGKGEMTYAPLRKPAAEDAEWGADNDAPAEAEYGIEIDVDLPRKRIKGLAMLSGGERALVSSALLFAITAVNPPPFLVLDETDAALDEANSQKYANILKELAKKTQLVLITHNRETMKQAGVLYGVTMGEDGISKVLSLKLEEAKDYGNR